MKNCLIIILWFIFYSVSYAEEMNRKTAGAFYIWNRNWNSGDVIAAAEKNNDCDYYFLAGEFFGKKKERITPDKEFFSLPNNEVPVFRIHNEYFKKIIKKPEKLTSEIICEFRRITTFARKNGKEIKELQIDLDCPTSKLPLYGTFLRKLRSKMSNHSLLSFTALPCHLGDKNFIKVVKYADYYVLQVHGLEVPEKWDQKVSILNMNTAERAIENAEKINSPYLLALPTYAYQLNFNIKSKKFLFLNAEKTPPSSSEVLTRTIAPKVRDLVYFVKKVKSGRMQHCRGIVWFRLPVISDQYNFDIKTLTAIRKGEIPIQKITAYWKNINKKTSILIVKNQGILTGGEISINLQKSRNDAPFELFKGFKSRERKQSFILPEEIIGTIPPPGKEIPVGWFRTNNNKQIKIKVKVI
jgi:hypothetical protein